MNNQIKGLCEKYWRTNRFSYESLALDLDDLLQECSVIEWKTVDSKRVLHNCRDHLTKLLVRARTLKRRHSEISLDDPNYSSGQRRMPDYLILTKEEQKESWIYPGFGYENIFEIFKSGNYNANARFEYDINTDKEEWRHSRKEDDSPSHIYLELPSVEGAVQSSIPNKG